MQQNYVLDAIAGQGWLGSLTILPGITISMTAGHTSYVEPATVSQGQPFTVYFTVNNVTGYTQNIYSQIVYTPGGTDVIPGTYYAESCTTGTSKSYSYYFPSGVQTTQTWQIQAGHAEYTITTNATGAGSITITPMDAGGPPYYPGQTIRATAVSSGGTFTGWSGYLAGYGTQSPVDFDMPLTDITINAAFTGADVYGSCCIGGNCTQTTQANCAGTWTANQSCTPNPCSAPPATGACCIGTNCSITTQAACAGVYQGDNTTCSPTNPCAGPGDCTNPPGTDGTPICLDDGNGNGFQAVCNNGVWEWVTPPASCALDCTTGTFDCVNGYVSDCIRGNWVPSDTRCYEPPTQGNMLIVAAAVIGGLTIIALLSRSRK